MNTDEGNYGFEPAAAAAAIGDGDGGGLSAADARRLMDSPAAQLEPNPLCSIQNNKFFKILHSNILIRPKMF